MRGGRGNRPLELLKNALRREAAGSGRAGSAAVTVGGSLGGAAGAFAAAILAARVLPPGEFAAFGVGLAVHSFCVQLADFGLGMVAVTELATGRQLRGGAVDYGKLRPLALRRLASAIAVGAAMIIIGVAIPALAPYRLAILVGAGGAVFWSMDQFLVSALQGLRRFDSGAFVLTLIGILRIALVSVCAVAGVLGIGLLVAYAVVAPAVAMPVAAMVLLAQRGHPADSVPGPEEGGRQPPASPAVDAEFRRSVAVTYLGGAALFNLDVLILALVASQADVATYSAAWRVAAGASIVNTAITQAVLPYTIAAPDPWREARLLSKAGLILGSAWMVLVPVVTLVGLAILGSAGHGAAGPMAVLLVAFALDGFCDLAVQVYYRVNRARVAALNRVVEFTTMAALTVALQSRGALAPSIGQLGARVLGVVIIGGPIVLAAVGRLRWFAPAQPDTGGHEVVGVDVRGAEERLGL